MTKEKAGNTPDASAQPQGLGYNGEFKIGRITLATRNSKLVLRKEYEGSEVEIDEPSLEGVLDDAFFKRQADGAGNVTIGKKVDDKG